MPSYHCRFPTCKALLKRSGYCEQHQQNVRDDRKAMDQFYDRHKRDPRAQQFYHTKEWESCRNAKLHNEPFCEFCEKALATEVHHKIPLLQDWELRTEPTNLMSTCQKCHKKHEARERRKAKHG